MSFRILIYLLFVVALTKCIDSNREINLNGNSKIKNPLGYLLPDDSIVEPRHIIVDKTKLKKTKLKSPAAVPFSFFNNDSVSPDVVIARNPIIIPLDSENLDPPQILQVFDSVLFAGIPDVSVAKDIVYKENNPASIYYFSKIQGLKHSGTRSLLKDKLGNMWFGSYGGGVTRYDGKYFSNYTEKHGLPSNRILDMIQDSYGTIWFATDRGVCRFNGKHFIHFKGIDGIANGVVLSVFEDSKRNIWFGTFEGLAMFKRNDSPESKRSTIASNDTLNIPVSGIITVYSKKNGLLNDHVSSIYEDFRGNIWFGSPSGVTCFNGKNFKIYNEDHGLAGSLIRSISEDKHGNLWFGTLGGGVSCFDGNRIDAINDKDRKYLSHQEGLLKVNDVPVKTFRNYSEKNGLVNNNVFSFQNDSKGNLWIGSQFGGVSVFDGKNFVNYTENDGLPHNRIFKMTEDKSGNMWLATELGVAKIMRESFRHYFNHELLKNYKFRCVFQDKDSVFWFGTYASGVIRYDGKSLINYTEKEGLAHNKVFNIFQDSKGVLWFTTYGGGVTALTHEGFVNYTEDDGLSNKRVVSVMEDKQGLLWFCTQSGGVSCFDGNRFINYSKKSGLAANDVKCAHQDSKGILWFGTNDGITKFDGKQFTKFTVENGLPVNSILCIFEDDFGHLWFGTDEGGVVFYDGEKFRSFSENEGLTHHVVTKIFADKLKNLWIVTRFGLSKLTKNQVAEISENSRSKFNPEYKPVFYNYNFNDGYLGIGCEAYGSEVAKDGTLWFFTNNGISLLKPLNNFTDTIPPEIKLTGIDLYNESVNWLSLFNKPDTNLLLTNGVVIRDYKFDSISGWYNLPVNLSLAHNNNFMNFNVIGITMDQPQKVKYQYKLEGLDDKWGMVTDRTNASYGNLSAGTYTFMVKAQSSKGYWSKEYHYVFTVRPPWWKTGWFRLTLIAIVITGVVIYIKWRERKLILHQKELEYKIGEATLEITQQKHLIELKHQEITDSINYAERIQRSFLATKEMLDQNLKDYFVFFKPKDIVSGDFYWATYLPNGNFVYVVADSTGHGVPGAIMSVLNISSLEKSIETKTEPSEILNKTREIIIDRLKKDGTLEGGKDGMDCSLIMLDKERKMLFFAAANNPVWIIRNNELIELKPDKMPVGKHEKDSIRFTQTEMILEKGDVIYSLTDGFPDQFGGSRGKKYMYKNLKQFLVSVSHLPMTEQFKKLESEFNLWKGDLEQVDDVTVVGIRI